VEVVTTFSGVETKSGDSLRGAWIMRLFADPSGVKYQTFDKGLGETGQGFVGTNQPVRVVYEVEQRGDFSNNVIKALEAAPAGLSAPPAPESTQAVAAAPAPTPTSQGLSVKDEQIHRQTAAKVAAKLLQHFPEEERTLATFDSVVDHLVQYFNHGR
jgi:hypothetical protein